LFQAILDMIYPVRCPICTAIVLPKGEKICPSCKERLPVITGARCLRCSKPIEQEEKEFCSDCERKNYHYDKGIAVWLYNDEMKKSLVDFKYHNKKENGKFYIEESVRQYGDLIKKINPDVLVPVPIHTSKHLERGYNQADILAKGIGKQLGIPVLSKLLLRNKKTLPQKSLSDKERLRNLSQAFSYNETEARKHGSSILRVLLVDDIYTTGSTIEACTNVLRLHNVTHTFFIVICIGKGY